MTTQGWGTPVTQKAEKRTVPYLEFNGSDIKKFAPLNGAYNFTVLAHNGWAEPFEMWEYEVRNGKQYIGNFFSRQATFDDECPFKKANDEQLKANNGVKIENKNRVYPISCKYWMMIKVDEIPELPYLLYGVSKKGLEKIINAFGMANGGPTTTKITVMRSGEGLNTDYTFMPSQLQFDPNTAQIPIPQVDPENFKPFFIGLENVEKVFNEYENNFDNMPAEQPAQPAQTGWGSGVVSGQPQAPQATGQAPQQFGNVTGQANPFGGQQAPAGDAGEYVIASGPNAGKKLSELDISLVQMFTNLEGELAEKAKAFLASKGM